MKIIISIVVCCLVLGCAQKTVRPATPTSDMVQDYGKEYARCLAAYVPQLDDGQSDAMTVARGLDGFCIREFDRLVNYEKPSGKTCVQGSSAAPCAPQ